MTPHEIRQKYSTRHPSTVGVLQFFADSHLHESLKRIVVTIRELAFDFVDAMEDGPELTVGLRSLLDAKDSMVRHYLVTHDFMLNRNET